MLERICRVLSLFVLILNAPEALAACLPDPPADGDAVVCDGTDSTGYDGSGATGLTITTNGAAELDESSPALDSAILVSDDNTVTIGVDAQVTVTEAFGFGIRGNNDNFIDNQGTITIDAMNGRGISLNENTTGVLPNGAVNSGDIFAIGAGSIGLETGINSGVSNGGLIDVIGNAGRGISASDRTDLGIAANISNTDTINVIGDDAFGIKAGDGWLEATIVDGEIVPSDSGILNFFGASINVTGDRSVGIFAGDETNLRFNNNSFVTNRGTIDVSGVDAIGISLGGNDIADRFDVGAGVPLDSIDFINNGKIMGSADAGPLVEFRGFVAGKENRILISATGRIEADLTNQGMTNRAIAISGSDGDELVVNSGDIVGDIALNGGNDRYAHTEGATITGRVLGGSGRDELILGFVGGALESFDVSALVDFERIQIFGGTGWELTNAAGFTGLTDVAADGRLQIPTSITLGGDFSLDSKGTLDVTLAAATTALTVEGMSALDGTLVPTAAASFIPSATPYRVVDANGGYTGRFQLDRFSGLNSFTLIYDAAGVSLLFERGLVAVARGANQRAIAQNLTDIDTAGGASADLQNLIDSFETSTGRLSSTLNSLSPEVYDVHTQIVVEGGRRIANLLLDRPRECRTGQRDPWKTIDTQLPCHASSWAPWVAAVGGFRSREKFSHHPRYDSQMGGLVAGIDTHPMEGLDLTFAISSQRGTLNAAGAGESTLTLTDVSGQAAWSMGRVRTQSFVSWGHGFHKDRRLIRSSETSAPLNSRGQEEHDSDRITAAVEIGVELDVGGFEFEPLVGVDWAWVYQRPIHESDAGGFGVRIASRKDSIGSVNAGFRVSTIYRQTGYIAKQLEWLDGVWRPLVEVRWRQVLEGDKRDIDARFQGSPDSVPDFRISGEEDDGGAEIGAGFSFTPKNANRLQFDLRYDAFVAPHTVEHNLVGRVKLGF